MQSLGHNERFALVRREATFFVRVRAVSMLVAFLTSMFKQEENVGRLKKSQDTCFLSSI